MRGEGERVQAQWQEGREVIASEHKCMRTYPTSCQKCFVDMPEGRKHRWCLLCCRDYNQAYTKASCTDCRSAAVLKGRTRCRHCQTVWNKLNYDPDKQKPYMDAYYAANKDAFLENVRRRKARRKGAKVVKKVNIRRVIETCQDRCQFCGVDTSTGGRHIDHIFPLKRGGTHEESNLQVLCAKCNRAKSTMTMEEFVAAQREVMSHSQVSVTDPRGHSVSSPPVTG